MREKKNNLILAKMTYKDLISLILLIVSLIYSVVGILRYGVIYGIIATITGIVSLATLKKENEEGRQLAFLGITIGITDIVMAIVWTIYYSSIS